MSFKPKTYRDFILEGNLPLPQSLTNALADTTKVERLWGALWYNYVKNKGRTSTIYHLEQYDDVKEFNSILKFLADREWINVDSTTKRNWSEIWLNEEKILKYVTKKEIDDVRRKIKMKTYILSADYNETAHHTKVAGKVLDTGITREGFAKASKSQFMFDIDAVNKYIDIVMANVHKSMDKMDIDYSIFENSVDYREVCELVMTHYISNPNRIYTTGKNVNDSRGRAISSALSKIFNPISSKDARSMLIIDKYNAKKLTKDGLDAVYLFIAELTGGSEAESFAGKTNIGMYSYLKRTMPHNIDDCWQEDEAKAEEARKEFHENIWLERIYKALDEYHANPDMAWTVPIELDGTASMLQIQGVLLDHKTFCDKTNVINAMKLEDAWNCEGIDRTAFKKVATPTLYGSSATPQKLWNTAKYSYTREELVLMNRELRSGYLAVAQAFKEFIIGNVKPKLKMKVKIWGEVFWIKCNRYRNVGDYVQSYDVYDSKNKLVTTVRHTITHKEEDLKQFKRFFVTLLIHHLDSRVADYVCVGVEWCIPIHDAFIVHPSDAKVVRIRYCAQLNGIYKDREKILKEYFYSIGIDSKSAIAWTKVKKLCIPMTDFVAEHSALK